MITLPEHRAILLADDSEADVILIQRTLKSLNTAARVIVVSDGEGVLCYLNGEGKYADRVAWPLPFMLILDQRMPMVWS